MTFDKKAYDKKWKQENREHHAASMREYRERNKERLAAERKQKRRLHEPVQRILNPTRERRRALVRDRLKTDIHFRLRSHLATRLWTALKRRKQNKVGSAVRDLGCTLGELRAHLESRFQTGMTWENYGPGWHIDHIIPLAAFDLSNRHQFMTAAHYTNLQPMWASENMRKGDKWVTA